MSPREWDADAYDRLAAPMTRWGRAVVERLDLRGDERVLDAGCGTGKVTAILRERLPDGEIVGLDGSRSMIALARERLGEDQTQYVVADLLEPLPIDPPVHTIALGDHVQGMGDEERRRFAHEIAIRLPASAIDYVRLNITARRAAQ